jgi:hypothetical protein
VKLSVLEKAIRCVLLCASIESKVSSILKDMTHPTERMGLGVNVVEPSAVVTFCRTKYGSVDSSYRTSQPPVHPSEEKGEVVHY